MTGTAGLIQSDPAVLMGKLVIARARIGVGCEWGEMTC